MVGDDVLQRPEVVANPYPLYARLRAEDPVHWIEARGAWVLTRYADVVASLRDRRLSCRPGTLWVRRLHGAAARA